MTNWPKFYRSHYRRAFEIVKMLQSKIGLPEGAAPPCAGGRFGAALRKGKGRARSPGGYLPAGAPVLSRTTSSAGTVRWGERGETFSIWPSRRCRQRCPTS